MSRTTEFSEPIAIRLNAELAQALQLKKTQLEKDLGIKIPKSKVAVIVIGKYLRSAFPEAFQELIENK